MHFNTKKDTAGFKMSQHVRDNRRGPVCHHAVTTATNLLLGVHFERVQDSSESSIRSMTKKQLAPTQGGGESGLNQLGFLECMGDRAYQNAGLFYDVFLKSGTLGNLLKFTAFF